MLLERFGLWEVRHERVSTFSRGMQQRLGLCRVLLHDPELLVLDEPFNALDAAGRGAARRDARRAATRPRRRRRDPRPAAASSARDRTAGVRVSATSATSRALARKDLLLELRAKETLPAMLLFVLAALTIFHFALPAGAGDVAALGLLWIALVFTALLGLTRAFVRRARAADDGRARPRAVRPERDLAREVDRRFAFLVAGGAGRTARVRALLLGRRRHGRSPPSRSRTSASAPSAR